MTDDIHPATKCVGREHFPSKLVWRNMLSSEPGHEKSKKNRVVLPCWAAGPELGLATVM